MPASLQSTPSNLDMDSTTRGLSSSSGAQRPHPRTTGKDAVVPLLSPPTLSPVVSDTAAAFGPSSATGGGPEPLGSASQPRDIGTMPINSPVSCRSTPAQSLRQATIVGSSGAVRAPSSPTTFLEEDTAASRGSPQQQPPPLPQPSRGMYPNSRTKPPQRQGPSAPSSGGFGSKPSHAGSRICATNPATGTRQRLQQHQRFPPQQQGMCSLSDYPPHMMVPPTGHLRCRAPYGVYQDPATMYNCTPQSLQQPQQPSYGPGACSQPQHYNNHNGAAAAAAYYHQCCQFYQQQQGYMYAAQQQQAATLASSGGAGPSASTLMAGHGYTPNAQGGYYCGAGALQKQMMSGGARGMGPAGHNGFPRGPPSSVGYGGAHYVSNPHSGGDASGDYYASGGADVQYTPGRMGGELTAHPLGSGAYNGEEYFEVSHGTNGFPQYLSGSDALYPKEEPRPPSNGFRGNSIASKQEVPRTNPGEALVGGSSSSMAGVAPTACVHAAAEGAVPSSRRGSTFLQPAPLSHSVPLGHASSAPIGDTGGSARRGGAVQVASTSEVDSDSTHPHSPVGEPWRGKDHPPPSPAHGPTGPTTASTGAGATSPNSLGAEALFTPGGAAESASAPQDPLPVPTTHQCSLRRHPSALVHHKHHFNLTPAARNAGATVASPEVLMSPTYRSPATPTPALARRRPAPPAAVTPTSLRAMPMHGGDGGFPPDPVGRQRAMGGGGAERHSSGSLSLGAGAASTMPAARRYLTTPDATGMGGGASKQSGRGGRSLDGSPEIPQQTQSPFSRANVTQSSTPLDPPVGRVSRHSPGTCVVASGQYMTAGSEGTYGGYVSPQPATYVQSQRGRSTGSLLQSQSGSGSGSVRGLPMGGPAGLLYEHHTGTEVWVEELEASEAPFDPNTFGNAACLVNAISPSVPVKYELEIPAMLPDRLPPQQSKQPPPDVVVGDAALSVDAAPPTARKSVPGALDTDTAAHPAVRPYTDFSGSFFTEPIASLDSIWKSFDFPFGCTVPLARSVYLSRMRAPEDNVVYVPLLSGFRIGFHDASQAYNQLHSLHRERQFTASPVSVDAQTGHMLLTWSASERPDNRNIVLAQVRELTACDAAYSVLLSANTADIDHQSWVAIMWQPVFCGGHSAKQSCGLFLAFYALRAPHHLFLPYAEKSTGAALNSSWRSPVFRIDRAAIFFNIWSFPRAYHVGRPVAGHTSAPSRRHEDLPDNGSQVAGGEGSPATPAPRPSTDTGDLRDGTASPGFIRLAVVGLIPNRCRPDVWLVPAMMSMEQGGANGGGGGDGRGGCSWSMRAPLFLLASALQLMAWNAYEEDQRHQRLVADSRQQRRQPVTLAPPPSATAQETTAAGAGGSKDAQSPPCVAAPSTAVASSMLSRIVQHTLSSNNQFRLAARPTASSAPPSSTESVLDDVLQSTQSSMLQPCNSSDDILTQPIETVSGSQEYAEMGSAAPPEAGGEESGDAALLASDAQLYAKGVALLKDAALRYRVLRVRAMLDVTGNNTEEVTTTASPAATHSDAGSGGDAAAPSMGPVMAGGTSAGLCGEGGGVIVGLLDFYQWAQYDSALINFAERYCAV